MKKTRVAFHTLGCKLNFSETSAISRQLGTTDFELVDFGSEADVYVVHTCSVTAVAEKKCRIAIKQAHRRNPDAKVAVIGCAVQANPEAFSRMEGVSLALGNKDKFRLAELIASPPKEVKLISDINREKSFYPSYSSNDRTRSFFKVQDGCDYFCTFCSIPFMRGRSRSDSIANTLQVAREIAATTMKEIVLTGVNIGDFGRKNGEHFIDLLRQLELVHGIERIRISSVEPELLNDGIIELVYHSQKLLPHFHLPLQSGSDKILALMKRKYKREVFASRIKKIKSLMPHACIAADVITGFPGETPEDFDDGLQFIASQDVSYLHIFPYSERPGTKALLLENKVTDKEKQRRAKELHILSDAKKMAFYEQNQGTMRQILWESENNHGWMHGWTENYIHCRTPFNAALINQITPCTLLSVVNVKEPVMDVVVHA